MSTSIRALQPKYGLGQLVEYIDRHNRRQKGIVRSIDGHWYWEKPYLVYRLGHPTYHNGSFYCSEDAIKGVVDE